MTLTMPAGWAPVTAVAGPSWASYDESVQQAALDMACGVLWALSGRRFGLTRALVAPWIPRHHPRAYLERIAAPAWGWGWRLGFRSPWQACPTVHEVRLPGPVHKVEAITVDGSTLLAADWRCDPGGLLVHLGMSGWPVEQDMRNPGFTVLYQRGQLAPDGGNVAAGRYAGELARVLAGDPKARISGRARDVAKQGVSVALAAPEAMANNGLVGIPQVDAWLRAINPGRLTAPPQVYSPDGVRWRPLALPDEAL